MFNHTIGRIGRLVAVIAAAAPVAGFAAAPLGIGRIGHIVVIYGENRSFDHEYGSFPGARGLQNLPPAAYRQIDRDGHTVLTVLPPVWGGVIDSHLLGLAPPFPRLTQIAQSATENMPAQPFAINDPKGFGLAPNVATRDLYHRFYENQMQIHGGRNDMFAAWADSGGLTMGHYSYQRETDETAYVPLYGLAKKYVLADNFFQAAFGGSYLNHQFLICACAPILTPSQQTRRRTATRGDPVVVPVSAIHAAPDGTGPVLDTTSTSPPSALTGPPIYTASTNLAPADADGNFATINTMQPPYPPSGNGFGRGGLNAAGIALSPAVPQIGVNPDAPTTVPPQTLTTIGDLLSAANISWAWYAGAMNEAIAKGTYNGADGRDARGNLVPNFQPHHNPFNYYANFAPGSAARALHLRDGGLNGARFIADIDHNALPAVSFYKPQGNLNAHPSYSDITSGDAAIYDIVVNHLMKSPAWHDMVIVITYDENGGWWDHAAPPKGDQFGPGTRVPALIVSPFAKLATVDHTQYDTDSILRLIARRYGLPKLPGIARRDAALSHNGFPAMGDLTNALVLVRDER